MESRDWLVLIAFALPIVAGGVGLIRLSRWANARRLERLERGRTLDNRESWLAFVNGRYREYANHIFFDELPSPWRKTGTALAVAVVVVVLCVVVLIAVALMTAVFR